MEKPPKSQYVPDVGMSASLKKKLKEIEKRAQSGIDQEAKKAAKENQEQIAPGGKLPPQQLWLPVAPMPTDMCRVSPFFPTARQALAKRDFIRNMVITTSAWGKILYTGPKLTTYEEDCLNAILGILNEVQNRRETEDQGQTTYTYKGAMRPILQLVNPNTKKHSARAYKQVLSALELMLSSVIKMEIKKRTSKGTRKKVIIDMANLLTRAKWDEETKELTVTINPYFYENFARGTVTLLDVLQRAKLRSPIAKSLYRFVMSHKGNVWEGHFITLAPSLNLNLEHPKKKIKQQIKQAIKKLVEHKILEKNSGIDRGSDVAKLYRTQSAKKRRKRLK